MSLIPSADEFKTFSNFANIFWMKYICILGPGLGFLHFSMMEQLAVYL
jgi:hypothetical protein